jgi:hypothetical protein
MVTFLHFYSITGASLIARPFPVNQIAAVTWILFTFFPLLCNTAKKYALQFHKKLNKSTTIKKRRSSTQYASWTFRLHPDENRSKRKTVHSNNQQVSGNRRGAFVFAQALQHNENAASIFCGGHLSFCIRFLRAAVPGRVRAAGGLVRYLQVASTPVLEEDEQHSYERGGGVHVLYSGWRTVDAV